MMTRRRDPFHGQNQPMIAAIDARQSTEQNGIGGVARLAKALKVKLADLLKS